MKVTKKFVRTRAGHRRSAHSTGRMPTPPTKTAQRTRNEQPELATSSSYEAFTLAATAVLSRRHVSFGRCRAVLRPFFFSCWSARSVVLHDSGTTTVCCCCAGAREALFRACGGRDGKHVLRPGDHERVERPRRGECLVSLSRPATRGDLPAAELSAYYTR